MMDEDINVTFTLRPLARVERLLVDLTTQMETLMAKLMDIAAKVDTLQANVTSQKTVIEGTKTLLTGLVAMISSLKEQLDAAIAGGGTPEEFQAVADKLTQLEESVTTSTADLAAAVTANTPAA